MEMLANIILISLSVTASLALQVQGNSKSYQNMKRNMESCKKLARNPYFEHKMVIGEPWRLCYHPCEKNIDTSSAEIVFKDATPAVIQHFWSEMAQYVEEQPHWESASLLVNVVVHGTTHEMLMWPDQGAAGAFVGVPKDGGPAIAREGVPLKKFQLKLVRNGKYLVLIDCDDGRPTLSARTVHTPCSSEIAAVVAELGIDDDDFLTCNY